MTSIQDLFQQAQLAEAAYAHFDLFVDPKNALMDASNEMKFSDAQATAFINTWQVIDHIPDTTAGFSAAIFRNIQTGAYSLAIRGSTDMADFIADASLIALDGIAVRQVVDLYNFWQRAMTRAGLSYTAAKVVPYLDPLTSSNAIPVGNSGYGLVFTTSSELTDANLRAGTGVIPAGLGALTVAGHSLGGHLTMAFTRIFPTLAIDAIGINGLGFKLGNTTVDSLFSILGGAGASSFTASKIKNFYGIAGPEFAAMNNEILQQPGTFNGIYIESGGFSTIGGHSASQMTDSLALYSLYAKLAPGLTLEQITTLLNGTSPTAVRSLESALDVLRTVLQGKTPTEADPTTHEGMVARDSLYRNLKVLQDSAAYQTLAGSALLRLTTAETADSLAQKAKSDFGWFLAVQELLPIAIEGGGSALIGANPDLYGRWSADRAKRIEGSSDLDFTDPYLSDRSTMVAWWMVGNTNDRSYGATTGGENWQFLDVASGKAAYALSTASAIDRANAAAGDPKRLAAMFTDEMKRGLGHRVAFGGDSGDQIIGGALDDRLYGMAGKDVLQGLGGNDHIEGGKDDDLLTGGKGNDILVGGTGNDTYRYASGDGHDTIVDDGANRLMYDGKLIAGLVVKDASTGQYKFVDNSGKTIEFHSPGVLTLGDGETITFQNQTTAQDLDGSFGLQLFEETAAPVASRILTGDYLPFDFDVTEDGFQTQTDDLGNIILDATKPAPGRDDSLQDSTGNDIIQGFFGDDFLNAWRGGDDRIDGGEGMDWLFGGAGNDLVEGGFGRDVLIDASGNDRLYADGKIDLDDALALENEIPSGAQGEALSGGAGDDLAIGGVGNDIFFGGTEDDILIGGAGDDNFEGDLMASNILADWTVTRSTTTSNGATTYLRSYTQVFYGDPGVGGADTIYAGAGADWVMAGYGNDYVDGGNDADVLFGEAGNDDLFGGAGNDMLHGDTGSLPLAVHGNDYLDGEDGDDLAFGGGGNDELFGGTGADELYGNEGDDYVDGEDGADVLVGGSGADRIFGGAQDDFLQGDAGNGVGDGSDYLDGEVGNDILLGLGGGDTLHGGDGDDQIAGDNGGYDTSGAADTIYGGAGNDLIDGQGGDDVIDAGADNDIVAGGLGNDQIAGGIGYDQLQGGEGNDVLDGGSEGDTLFGEAGNDTLLGGAGNDYLIGGLGDDLLNGGDGDDVYFIGSGEGRDRIVDSGGIDWLVFNNILWGQLRLGTGSLKISLPDGSEIHLDDFDPDNPFASGGIEYFQFADNTVMSKNQLINALGIQPTGTPEADVLSGTALSESIAALAGDDVVSARAGNDTVLAGDGADVVYGGDGNDILYGGNGDDVLLGEAGNDTLHGEAGNDLLAGGAGTDALQGGEGDDTYLFQIGDGQDTATDALGSNAVALGTGLTLDAITFTRQGSDLLVAVKNSTDRLTVRDWFAAGSTFASITLGDGTLLDHAGVEAAMPRNQAPLVVPDAGTAIEDAITEITGNVLANDSDPEGRALRVTNPGIQAGAVGTLSLASGGGWSYLLANGAPAVQSLGTGQSLTESFAYTVSDDDPNGAATASSTIRISVLGANDLPVLGADSAATSEDAAAITGNLLSNDSDIDAGTTLNIANPGAKVGAYGTLNLAADGAWTYTLVDSAAVQGLADGQMVTESFAQTVSDGFAQVGGTLAIGIAGRNDAPIVATPLADQSAAANTSWSWTLPAGSFSDIDTGDVMSYAATLADGSALPSWLSFSATTQTFSGRVPKSASGSIDLRIAATDRAGASATDVFALSFTSGGGGNGGGGGGNTQGNEGVGNGIDAAPPGHDASFNDGTGTGPGNPGAQGGNGYRPPHRDQIVKTELRIAAPLLEAPAASAEAHGNSAAAHAAAPGQARQAADDVVAADAAVAPAPTIAAMAETADVSGPSPDTPSRDKTTADWLTDAAWAYLDRQGSDAVYQSTPGTDSGAAFAQWLAVEQALARDAAGGMPDWLDRSKGADLRGLLAINGGFLGSTRPIGADTLGLLGGAELKTFKGLGEGLQKIA